MTGEELDPDEERAWVEFWLEAGRDHARKQRLIVETVATALVRQAQCDVCAHIVTLEPLAIPEFVAAFDRVGPISDLRRIPVGIVSFARRDYLFHEGGHGH